MMITVTSHPLNYSCTVSYNRGKKQVLLTDLVESTISYQKRFSHFRMNSWLSSDKHNRQIFIFFLKTAYQY